MSNTPIASNEAPKTVPPSEAKPADQNNESGGKQLPDAPKQK